MKFPITLLLATFLFVSCDNASTEVEPLNPPMEKVIDTANQTLLSSGDFKGSSAHPSTTGKAKIYQDAANKRTLVLEDLKVDSGPDLRIYLAEDAAVTNFVEISNVVKNGTNSYTIPASVNLEKLKVVSVWCKQFSVSFGTSDLVKP